MLRQSLQTEVTGGNHVEEFRSRCMLARNRSEPILYRFGGDSKLI